MQCLFQNHLTFSQLKYYNKSKENFIMGAFLCEDHVITKIVLAICVPAGCGAAVHKNRPSHGLAFNCAGEKVYTFSDGRKYVVKENDFIYLPKNTTYTVSAIAPGATFCINFQLLESAAFDPFVFNVKNAETAIQAYKSAEKAWRNKKDGYELLCKSELYKILYVLQSNYARPYLPNSKQAQLEPAVSYIHKHYTEESISVEKLSELCGFSYEYFRRLFHGCYGCAPMKYINELKLKRAKELLASGLYSVSEAALQAGFFDLSYFSRFFKGNVGVSPVEYKLNGITDNHY